MAALIGQQLRREGPDIAKALNDHTRALQIDAYILGGFGGNHANPSTGGGFAPRRPSKLHRLSRDDSRGMAVAVAVLVHDPGHDLRVGIDVRSGDVPLDAQSKAEARGEAAGHSLHFPVRHLHGDCR